MSGSETSKLVIVSLIDEKAKTSLRQVTGIDINPLDLLEIPHNVNLESEDLNNRLTEVYPLHHYDLIQSRFVSGGIGNARWPSYVQELTQYVPTPLSKTFESQILDILDRCVRTTNYFSKSFEAWRLAPDD